MGKRNQPTPIEVAFVSACDRLDRFAAILTDPYNKVSDETREAIRQAMYAIEEEWIIDPSMRQPRP